MCGIAGLVSTPGASKASALDAVQRMTDRMRPRGPDAEELWSGEGVVLGHRRLAILDLDVRANQPMCRQMVNTSSFITARFTTSANCVGSWRRTALPFAPRPIRKSCWLSSPARGSACCPGCAACSPLPSRTHKPGNCSSHAILMASSRIITHARRTVLSSPPRSRGCSRRDWLRRNGSRRDWWASISSVCRRRRCPGTTSAPTGKGKDARQQCRNCRNGCGRQ